MSAMTAVRKRAAARMRAQRRDKEGGGGGGPCPPSAVRAQSFAIGRSSARRLWEAPRGAEICNGAVPLGDLLLVLVAVEAGLQALGRLLAHDWLVCWHTKR